MLPPPPIDAQKEFARDNLLNVPELLSEAAHQSLCLSRKGVRGQPGGRGSGEVAALHCLPLGSKTTRTASRRPSPRTRTPSYRACVRKLPPSKKPVAPRLSGERRTVPSAPFRLRCLSERLGQCPGVLRSTQRTLKLLTGTRDKGGNAKRLSAEPSGAVLSRYPRD